MGCPVPHLKALNVAYDDWEIVPFNGEPVERFVESLDVFSYFHSKRWVEAFGRTILEAMLMERPCVLDPNLRETFGTMAYYASPGEVHGLVRHLRADVKTTRQRCAEVRTQAVQLYTSKAIPARLGALQNDTGNTARSGPVQASPVITLRKLIGLKRRQRNTAHASQGAKMS